MSKIKGAYVPPKEIAKIVRTALRPRFGTENVRVRCETGTAYGWVDAMVYVPRPNDCYCSVGSGYCGRCSEKLHTVAPEARTLVRNAMLAADAQFGSYYGDMDNEPREEFMLQVQFITSEQK